MRQARTVGKVEIALASVAAVLIALEVGAILAGIGPFFTVVTLGYFLVIGGAYAVYRNSRIETALVAEAEAAEAASVEAVSDDEYAIASRSDLLQALSDEQVAEVLHTARFETIPAGTPMAVAGSTGQCVYVIIDGSVQLTGRSTVGEVTVRIAHRGEAFPLAALLGDGELVTSATAMTDVTAIEISRERLLALCTERPDIGMAIFRTTAEILADRYRSTLRRRLEGAEHIVRQPDMWANV